MSRHTLVLICVSYFTLFVPITGLQGRFLETTGNDYTPQQAPGWFQQQQEQQQPQLDLRTSALPFAYALPQQYLTLPSAAQSQLQDAWPPLLPASQGQPAPALFHQHYLQGPPLDLGSNGQTLATAPASPTSSLHMTAGLRETELDGDTQNQTMFGMGTQAIIICSGLLVLTIMSIIYMDYKGRLRPGAWYVGSGLSRMAGFHYGEGFSIDPNAWSLLGRLVKMEEIQGSPIGFMDWSLFTASNMIYSKRQVKTADDGLYWFAGHTRKAKELDKLFNDAHGLLEFKAQEVTVSTDPESYSPYWSCPVRGNAGLTELNTFIHVPYYCAIQLGAAADASFGEPMWIESVSDSRDHTSGMDSSVQASFGANAFSGAAASSSNKTSSAGTSTIQYEIIMPMARLGFDRRYMKRMKDQLATLNNIPEVERTELENLELERKTRRIEGVIIGVNLKIEGTFEQMGDSESSHQATGTVNYGLTGGGASGNVSSSSKEAAFNCNWVILRQSGIDVTSIVKDVNIDPKKMKKRLSAALSAAKETPSRWEPLFAEVNHNDFVTEKEREILVMLPERFAAYMPGTYVGQKRLLISGVLKDVLQKLFSIYCSETWTEFKSFKFDPGEMGELELILETAGFNIVSDYGFRNSTNELMLSRKAVEVWWTQFRSKEKEIDPNDSAAWQKFLKKNKLDGKNFDMADIKKYFHMREGKDKKMYVISQKHPQPPSSGIAKTRLLLGSTVPSASVLPAAPVDKQHSDKADVHDLHRDSPELPFKKSQSQMDVNTSQVDVDGRDSPESLNSTVVHPSRQGPMGHDSTCRGQ